MQWGTFTPAHIVSLVAAVGLILGLYFLLRNRSARCQTVVLGILSFSGIAAILYNLVAWGEPMQYLPLHLCSLNALVLPIAVFTRNKTLGNLLLVWSLGALAALICNWAMTEATIFDWPFNFYYFPHVLEFGIPILLFALRLVEKDPKCIGSTVVISMASYTAVHFINLAINACGSETVNYMYSVDPNENPMTALFYQVIPYAYWHMYMVLPIVVVYLSLLYLPQLRAMTKKRKEEKENAVLR